MDGFLIFYYFSHCNFLYPNNIRKVVLNASFFCDSARSTIGASSQDSPLGITQM